MYPQRYTHHWEALTPVCDMPAEQLVRGKHLTGRVFLLCWSACEMGIMLLTAPEPMWAGGQTLWDSRTQRPTAVAIDPFMPSYLRTLVSETDIQWILGNFVVGILKSEHNSASPISKKVNSNKTPTNTLQL